MAERYKINKDVNVDILINQFGLFDYSNNQAFCIVKVLSFIPNMAHLKRFLLPRIVKRLKRILLGCSKTCTGTI
jgi:hypothetical protein